MKQIGVCVNLQSKYSLDLTQFEKEGEKGIKKNRQKMNRIILIGNGFDLAKNNETQCHRRNENSVILAEIIIEKDDGRK